MSHPHLPIIQAHSNIPQYLDVSEALGVLEPPVQKTNNAHPHTPGSSYFSSYVEELYKNPSTIPIQLEIVSKSQPHICHPSWNEWEAIWGAPHLELDGDHILTTPELDFHDVLFRVQMTPEGLTGVDGPHFISQGTILAFKGFDASQVRYIVEWCYLIEDQKAYLKVVAINKNRIPYPYNDPHFPSFIFVVPTHLSGVPSPSSDNAPRSTVLQKLKTLRSRCPFRSRLSRSLFLSFLLPKPQFPYARIQREDDVVIRL